LKLFPDSVSTILRSQGHILLGALRLLSYAIVPMMVMLIPFCLILGQLALWFEFRPLHVGENAVVTMKLKENRESYWPEVNLASSDAIQITAGPVRVDSQREVCWEIEARQKGEHRLVFGVGGHTAQKELAIGEGFMRV